MAMAWGVAAQSGLLLGVGVLVLVWFYGAEGTILSIAMLAGAAGCIRLEASLFAQLGWPLVLHNSAQDCWRATYLGRNALWVGTPAAKRALLATPSDQATSAVITSLMQEGCLSRDIRHACRQLPASTMSAILLQLSLTEGGASVLHFLQASLPSPDWQQRANLYAKLATEAAKPLDLQRWLALLPELPAADGSAVPAQIDATLRDTRQALLQYQPQPIVKIAYDELQQLIQALNLNSGQAMRDLPRHGSLSWPLALWVHLEHHCQRLG